MKSHHARVALTISALLLWLVLSGCTPPPPTNTPIPKTLTPTYTNSISSVVLNPTSPAKLKTEQRVNLTFKYSTSESGGVIIYARPRVKGAPAPNYGAHASPVYPVGEGRGEGFITILSGQVAVDEIKFEMWTAGQAKLLYQFSIPVNYQFGN
ncbi:MAG: hypothetical protein HY327_06625 [Chloroflexi bacterium]|nr:hypothetical protein [Chloroflexota bacterium]